MIPTTPKRKGRPPGTAKPKAEKPKRPKGRPSDWPEELQPAGMCSKRVPLVVSELLDVPEFRGKFIELMLAFRGRTSPA